MRKSKRPKALWTIAFADQAKKLHPERSPSGGVRFRSKSQEVMMAVYRPIAELFKAANPLCLAHPKIAPEAKPAPTEDIHHKRGRSGLLLFDIRYFIPVCRHCHQWIEANKQQARALGLEATTDEWGKEL